MPTWINFKELRERLSFEQVLVHYKVRINLKRPGQHQGPCPLPSHAASNRSPSFSANLTQGIFQCFGCKAKGNVLDFAALMEGVTPKDGRALQTVALKLQQQFFEPAEPAKSPMKMESLPEGTVINAPLDFELKGLDASHPYLEGRGIWPETAQHFGLGVAARGLFKDRLAIPLHNQVGKLVGYAGRTIYDKFITDENPRYLFPGRRERLGVVHDFRKSDFLYNGFRMNPAPDDLIVVEGFTALWWLHQGGYTTTVATMGTDCSPEQAALLVSLTKPHSRIWIMPDGDADGEQLAESVLAQMSPHRFVRWVKLGYSQQPTDLSGQELAAHFRW